MFYISSVFNFLKQHWLKSLFFWTTSFVLISFVAHFQHWENKVFQMKNYMREGSHFFALVDERQNMGHLLRTVQNLPGVVSASSIEQDQVMRRARDILGQSGLDSLAENIQLPYHGLKIVFNNQLKEESQKIIYDYVQRFVGKANIIMGALRHKDTQRKKFIIDLFSLMKWNKRVWASVLSLLWILSFVLLFQDMKKWTYIASKFQRKKHIHFKFIFVTLFIIFMSSSSISAALAGGLNISYAFILAAFGLLAFSGMRKPTW